MNDRIAPACIADHGEIHTSYPTDTMSDSIDNKRVKLKDFVYLVVSLLIIKDKCLSKNNQIRQFQTYADNGKI